MTRLVPTRTSSRPSRERVDDALGGALALDDVPIQPPDPQPGVAILDLPLEALGAAAEVLDPGRAAVRAARRHRPGAAAVVAAQRLAGLVVDERPGAVRARGHVAAVAAQDHRRGAAPVDHEDRLLALTQVRETRREGAREHAEVARGELGPQVHDLDLGRRAGQPRREPDSLDRAVARVALGLHRWRRRAEHDWRAGELAERDRPCPGPGAAASGRSCTRRRAPRRRRSARRRPSARARRAGSRRPRRRRRAGSAATRRRARHRRARSGARRRGHRGRRAADRRAAARARSLARARAPAGRARAFAPAARRRSRSCRCRSRRRAGSCGSRRPAAARSTAAIAASCSSLSSLPGGRAPRRPTGRVANGWRGASRASMATSPRRARVATVDEPCRAASSGAGSPSGGPAARSSRSARCRGPSRGAGVAGPVRARWRAPWRARTGPSADPRPPRSASSRGRRARSPPARGGVAAARAGPPLPRGCAPAAVPRQAPRGASRPQARGRPRAGAILRASLGDELEPLQQPGREHRPQRQRRRREVASGNPVREAHAELGQERPVRSDPVDDRLRLDPGHLDARTQHQPERLSSPELDEDGLTRGEIREGVRNEVRVRAHARPRRPRRPRPRRSGGPSCRQTRVRRSGWAAFSARTMSSMRSAVRSTWSVSFGTT